MFLIKLNRTRNKKTTYGSTFRRSSIEYHSKSTLSSTMLFPAYSLYRLKYLQRFNGPRYRTRTPEIRRFTVSEARVALWTTFAFSALSRSFLLLKWLLDPRFSDSRKPDWEIQSSDRFAYMALAGQQRGAKEMEEIEDWHSARHTNKITLFYKYIFYTSKLLLVYYTKFYKNCILYKREKNKNKMFIICYFFFIYVYKVT